MQFAPTGKAEPYWLQLLGCDYRCIAIIGAGGKTTTMLALGDMVAATGKSVVLTTTTKIWPPPHRPLVLVDETSQLDAAVLPAFGLSRQVVVGQRIGPEGKVYGAAPDLVCDLAARGSADVILCEADGAAGRPLKVHGPGEPVVPACAEVVLIVAGIDVVGQPADADAVHRLPEFLRLVDGEEGQRIDAGHVAATLHAAARHAPVGARVVYVLNKVDDAQRFVVVREVAATLGTIDRNSEVVCTSHGRVAIEGSSERQGTR